MSCCRAKLGHLGLARGVDLLKLDRLTKTTPWVRAGSLIGTRTKARSGRYPKRPVPAETLTSALGANIGHSPVKSDSRHDYQANSISIQPR